MRPSKDSVIPLKIPAQNINKKTRVQSGDFFLYFDVTWSKEHRTIL